MAVPKLVQNKRYYFQGIHEGSKGGYVTSKKPGSGVEVYRANDPMGGNRVRMTAGEKDVPQ